MIVRNKRSYHPVLINEGHPVLKVEEMIQPLNYTRINFTAPIGIGTDTIRYPLAANPKNSNFSFVKKKHTAF